MIECKLGHLYPKTHLYTLQQLSTKKEVSSGINIHDKYTAVQTLIIITLQKYNEMHVKSDTAASDSESIFCKCILSPCTNCGSLNSFLINVKNKKKFKKGCALGEVHTLV